jgi:type VI secretion system protein VasD
VVDLTFDVQPNVNPDTRGRASPVVVRIYELKSVAGFNRADFFSLYEHDKETLGEDLIARDEAQLLPGNTSQLQRQLQPDTRSIGVVAAFRDLEHAQWRATSTVLLNKTTKLKIRLAQNQINVAAE